VVGETPGTTVLGSGTLDDASIPQFGTVVGSPLIAIPLATPAPVVANAHPHIDAHCDIDIHPHNHDHGHANGHRHRHARANRDADAERIAHLAEQRRFTAKANIGAAAAAPVDEPVEQG
jgi:hypothetical protein